MKKPFNAKLLVGILFIPILCLSQSLMAQITQNGVNLPAALPSPNAMSLGIYEEIPVSLNTGIPNIDIPIYELQGKSIGLNLSLSYHAQGVRPEIPSGWVGQNWALNAGGVITRKVNGYKDEFNGSLYPEEYSGNYIPKGYYYSCGAVWNGVDWNNISNLLLNGTFDYTMDYEPDEFSFSFMGFSGRFMLNHLGQWVVYSDQNLKVEFTGTFISPLFMNIENSVVYNWLTPTFKEFIITDGNGTRYHFGGTNNSIEYSDVLAVSSVENPNPPKSSPEAFRHYSFNATSWYLTKIESADLAEKIELEYIRGPFIAQLNKSYGMAVTGCSNNSSYSFSSTVGGLNYSGQYISPVYLKTISFPEKGITIELSCARSDIHPYTWNNYVNAFHLLCNNECLNYMLPNILEPAPVAFDYTNYYNNYFYWVKLRNIVIKDASESTLKQFNFKYTNVNERQFLYEFNQSLPNNKTKKHSFTYTNKDLLPAFLTTITDHWGFNNGTSFPTALPSLSQIYSLKEPNEKVIYGTLRKIEYPTGGFDIFTFGPNGYSAFVKSDRTIENESGVAGGLLIKKIEHIDLNGHLWSKTYQYSGGILNAKPSYSFSKSFTYNNASYNLNILRTDPIFPLTSTSGGNQISYSKVNEVLDDGSKTEYTFSSYATSPDDACNGISFLPHFPLAPINSKDQERGNLLSKTEYNTAGKTVRIANYTYKNVTRNVSGSARAMVNLPFAPVANLSIPLRVAYEMYNYSRLMEKATVTDYFYQNNISSGSKTLRTEYLYSNNWVNNPTLITNSYYASSTEGLFRKQEFRYINDIATDLNQSLETPSSPSNDYVTMLDLANKNIINNPIETINYEYVSDNDFRVTSSTLKEFKEFSWAGIPNYSFPYPWKVYELETTSSQANYTKASVGESTPISMDTNLKHKLTIDYDMHGNIKEACNDEPKYSSYQWGQNGNLYAKAVNAMDGEWFHEGFEDGLGSFTLGEGSSYQSTTSKTGTKGWTISSGGFKTIVSYISKDNLNPSGRYVASAWAKVGSGTPDLLIWIQYHNGTSVVADAVSTTFSTIGEWQYRTVEVNLANYPNLDWIAVVLCNGNYVTHSSGSVTYDDVRFTPVNTQVESYTWKPGVGVTSITDDSSRIKFFEYDSIGRLILVLDQDKNILNRYEYNYAR